MKYLSLLLLLPLMGCSSSNNLTNFMDRLEFDEGQSGCVRAEGLVQVGGNPFATSRIQIDMVKTQGDDPGEC